MRIRVLALVTIVLCVPLASPGQEKKDNPFKTAKVGDYVAYKMTTSVAGMDVEASMKQTISAKSDKEVTLKTTAMVGGNNVPAQETKIDLTKPYDPTAAATGASKKGKFDKTGEGKEKVKIGDKSYDCTWLSGKLVADAAGLKLESDVKIWFSTSVPLTGMVKMEMKSNLANVTMELTESGGEK